MNPPYSILEPFLIRALEISQEKLIVLGDINTINNALSIQQEKSRETYLKNMLIS